MGAATAYTDLNAVLDELVAGARLTFGANLVAVYLQGSFAIGDADVHSDVDFVAVTEDEVTPKQQAGLQALHGRIYERDTPWAQHLEGSYIPRDRIRRIDPTRALCFYLDNGATELEWDNHCNTAVVRWSLRENGVVLTGPDPKTLIDPVTAEQLDAEIRAQLREYAAFARSSQERFEVPGDERPGMSRWKQQFLVLSFCRMLHTLASGRITSKKEAGTWAIGALDPRWKSLVQRALDDRPDPWERVHQPAEPEAIEQTLGFVDDALREAGAET